MAKRRRKQSKSEKRKTQRKGFWRRWMPWFLLAVAGGFAFWAIGRESGRLPVLAGAAPGFTLPSANGAEVALSAYIGERPVILFFYMFSA
ncbi:MAG: hypothetical protein GTO63_09900 [Anaerolineae bacterium]|nr:hypothetical protein [Anaerolineae bacterium]NIN95227.1 hypothetical protein [Anaerolineae bacterium]